MRKFVHRILLLVGFIALALGAVLSPLEANERTVGLFLNQEGSYDGYTLFAPMNYPSTYLIDNGGRLVNSWDSNYNPLSPYLLEDGSLIQTASLGVSTFAPGRTGRVERFSWDGSLIWEFEYSTPDYISHHDLEVLPNGNVLIIAFENRTSAEAIAAGRDPALLRDGELWPEHIIEVEPIGASGGNIVWEWHAWDHLIQDYDDLADNYGVVADHPELIDTNFIDSSRPADGEADWHHANAIDYNKQFDQIVLSVRHFSEIWVIDHSTTAAEAADHNGGASGKGGDLLYRWGNPQAYRAGDASDKKLFWQHDAEWIEPGMPGEGNILVYNNGNFRPGGNYSSADEIVPPVDNLGNYSLTPGQAYEPQDPIWTYGSPGEFYSSFISSADRLPNGNTLICSCAQGTFLEVTAGGTIVWKYVNPVTAAGPLTQGAGVLGNFVFRALRYAPDFAGLAGRDLTPGGRIEIGTGSVPPAAVDLNGDGQVALRDLMMVVQCLGKATSAPGCGSSDVNGDGGIGLSDLMLVVKHYGQRV